ncbi:MAG: amidohydrolase family protein [Acidobacteriota bacterium]
MRLRLFALWLFGSTLIPSHADTTAIVGVNLIPMDRERIVKNQTVIVRDGVIVQLGDRRAIKIPEGARRIDAKGRFLTPGLGEMHAHIPGASTPRPLTEKMLRLWVANGVTTIRGMLGEASHLTLRGQVESGEVLGPHIVTAGPSLNGNSVTSPEAAVAAVREQKAAGYDFLKIHPGLKRDVFDALARTADEVGIRFAGHIPTDVGLEHAIEKGYWSVEHNDGFIEALVKQNAGVDLNQPTFFGLGLEGFVDESKLPALIEAARQRGVWFVPTESLMQSFVGDESLEALFARPELKQLPAEMTQQWKAQLSQFRSNPGLTRQVRETFLALRRRILLSLHRAGVGIALGSDSIQIMNVPGYSTHHELEQMVAAGLTPFEALQLGTVNVAKFLGRESDSGTISVGKRADLVLLTENPLKKISAIRSITAVMLRGAWLDRAALDKLLSS